MRYVPPRRVHIVNTHDSLIPRLKVHEVPCASVVPDILWTDSVRVVVAANNICTDHQKQYVAYNAMSRPWLLTALLVAEDAWCYTPNIMDNHRSVDEDSFQAIMMAEQAGAMHACFRLQVLLQILRDI